MEWVWRGNWDISYRTKTCEEILTLYEDLSFHRQNCINNGRHSFSRTFSCDPPLLLPVQLSFLLSSSPPIYMCCYTVAALIFISSLFSSLSFFNLIMERKSLGFFFFLILLLLASRKSLSYTLLNCRNDATCLHYPFYHLFRLINHNIVNNFVELISKVFHAFKTFLYIHRERQIPKNSSSFFFLPSSLKHYICITKFEYKKTNNMFKSI